MSHRSEAQDRVSHEARLILVREPVRESSRFPRNSRSPQTGWTLSRRISVQTVTQQLRCRGSSDVAPATTDADVIASGRRAVTHKATRGLLPDVCRVGFITRVGCDRASDLPRKRPLRHGVLRQIGARESRHSSAHGASRARAKEALRLQPCSPPASSPKPPWVP